MRYERRFALNPVSSPIHRHEKAAAGVEVSDGSLRIVSGCLFGATASAAWHAPSAAGSSAFSFVACRLVSCCLHVVLSQRVHIATDDGRSVCVGRSGDRAAAGMPAAQGWRLVPAGFVNDFAM
jgi:hypothetical protein